MMQTIDIIHINGGFTTLRFTDVGAYGTVLSDLSRDEDIILDSMDGKGAVFREKEDKE